MCVGETSCRRMEGRDAMAKRGEMEGRMPREREQVHPRESAPSLDNDKTFLHKGEKEKKKRNKSKAMIDELLPLPFLLATWH